MEDALEGAAETFDRGVEKGWEKIPDKFFNTDTYKPGKSGQKAVERNRRRSRLNAAGGAAAGAGAAEIADSGRSSQDDDDNRPRRSSQRYSQDDSSARYNPRYPRDDDAAAGYPHQTAQTQSDRAQYSQGDPNFPAHSSSYQPYNPNAFPNDSKASGMGDNYYPPPPAGGGYHRYNPADYQPRDGYAAQGGYQPTRNEVDAYQRPGSGGYQVGRPGRDYDDGYGSDRYSDDRGRDHEHRHKHRDRSPSPSNPVVRNMHKHLDTTGKGLAAGAIGGLVGHKLGKSPLATVAGVVIGGVGANAWEAREERHKEEEHRREKEKMAHRRARSEGPASDYYDDRARGSSRGRRSIGRYDDAEDDYDSEEDYRRRQDDRKSHRRSRSRRDSRDYD